MKHQCLLLGDGRLSLLLLQMLCVSSGRFIQAIFDVSIGLDDVAVENVVKALKLAVLDPTLLNGTIRF